MIIGIDGNEANSTTRLGVGQYAFNLLKNINLIDKDNRYIVYLKNPPLSDLPKENKNWRYEVCGPQKFWTKIGLPLRLCTQKEKLNLFYSPGHYSPALAPCPTVPTIHDLGYLQTKDQFTKKDIYQLVKWTEQSIKKSAHIITVSNFSKTELEKIYKVDPKKITIAYNGVENPPQIDSKTQQQILSKYSLKTKNYFLYLGTLKPNKNIPFLIKAFAKYPNKDNTKLVIAGKKGWLFNEIFETVKKEGIESSVIFTDFIDESQKWILYKNALALVLPSIYEGFGIPVIEAMKLNTPVVSSNIPSLKEVVENNGLYFDPKNQQELLDQLIKIKNMKASEIEKMTRAAKVRADFFNWENTAKSVLSVFEKFSK